MIKILKILVPLLLLSTSIYADTPDPSVIEIFNEAKSLFIKANDLAEQYPEKALELYHKSALHFESLYINHALKNGKLFYNTGNAYFKAGYIGKAILYYKRALAYIPNDKNLQHNLDFVRSRRVDQMKEKEKNQILRIIFFVHYQLSSSAKLTFLLIFFILFWISASLVLVFKKGYLTWLKWSALTLFFAFFISFALDIGFNLFYKQGVITAESVIARKGDSVTYQPSFVDPLHEGTEFKLIEERRDWLNIELNNGKQCWIETKHAELVNEQK
ncbi:MAG: tetratricopeptide repeat protein [Spirochaetes bacterium]|nr:tetratricopeptide repeat protein [Spirochaetota bacterium]